MDEKGLNKQLKKTDEYFRNIKYQIESIKKDIEKSKKPSNINKRIDRLVDNYKKLEQKKLINIPEKKKREINGKRLAILKQIKEVCYKVGRDDLILNTELDENNSKKKIIHGVYDSKDNLWFIYSIGRKSRKKPPLIKRVFRRMKKVFRRIKKNSLLRRITAFGMGSLMLFPGTIVANQNENNTESQSTKNSYIDTIKQKPVNEHEFIKIMGDFKNDNSLNMNQNIKSEEAVKEEKLDDKSKDDVPVHIIAPAQSKYTEVSDGRGNYGFFTEDTEVSIYNRALIRTNKDGSKSILKATKAGQTWKQYAEEQGIDYNEFKTYIENNENIQEVLSTMSVDGKSIYGWMLASELEYKTQDKEINVQRNYVTEVEER